MTKKIEPYLSSWMEDQTSLACALTSLSLSAEDSNLKQKTATKTAMERGRRSLLDPGIKFRVNLNNFFGDCCVYSERV